MSAELVMLNVNELKNELNLINLDLIPKLDSFNIDIYFNTDLVKLYPSLSNNKKGEIYDNEKAIEKINAFIKRNKASIFLLITIMSLWLPYAFIGRVMFLYHFFPVLPFMMLSIVKLFSDIEEKYKINYLIPTYMIFVILFFIIYYPVVSGTEVSIDYINNLRLFSSWIF